MSAPNAIARSRSLGDRFGSVYHRVLRASAGAQRLHLYLPSGSDAGELSLSVYTGLSPIKEHLSSLREMAGLVEAGEVDTDFPDAIEHYFYGSLRAVLLAAPTASLAMEKAASSGETGPRDYFLAHAVDSELVDTTDSMVNLEEDVSKLLGAMRREWTDEDGPEKNESPTAPRDTHRATDLTAAELSGVLGVYEQDLVEAAKSGESIGTNSDAAFDRRVDVSNWSYDAGDHLSFRVPNEVLRQFGAEALIE